MFRMIKISLNERIQKRTKSYFNLKCKKYMQSNSEHLFPYFIFLNISKKIFKVDEFLATETPMIALQLFQLNLCFHLLQLKIVPINTYLKNKNIFFTARLHRLGELAFDC